MSNESDRCAACGKCSDGLKKCTACKLVKYCNVTCQKAHRAQHKIDCKRRVAELHEEALFTQPAPSDECPICLMILPHQNDTTYQVCCGKIICNGCLGAMFEQHASNDPIPCPFCREPESMTVEDEIDRMKERIEKNDAGSIFLMGCYYRDGEGVTQDIDKAIELWLLAAKLRQGMSSSMAHYSLGQLYNGRNDAKRAKYHTELAAIGGIVEARWDLGHDDCQVGGNFARGNRHFMIAARAGHKVSLNLVRDQANLRERGHPSFFSMEEYESALRSYKDTLDSMRSELRDKNAKKSYKY